MNLNYLYSCERGRDFWNRCGKLWVMHEMKKSLPSAQGIQKGFCSQHCAALCYGMCALWGSACIFEKHPAIGLCTKINKEENERKQIEILPDPGALTRTGQGAGSCSWCSSTQELPESHTRGADSHPLQGNWGRF